MKDKKIIGRKESVSIPELDLYDLDAKIDTGADSNALHCDDIYVDDDNIVHFKLLDEVHPAYNGKKMALPLYTMKKVRSSNGELQHRPSIRVQLKIFNTKYTTIISLTDRSDMKYPMLIGRKFLAHKFLVDVSKEYLSKTSPEERI